MRSDVNPSPQRRGTSTFVIFAAFWPKRNVFPEPFFWMLKLPLLSLFPSRVSSRRHDYIIEAAVHRSST